MKMPLPSVPVKVFEPLTALDILLGQKKRYDLIWIYAIIGFKAYFL
jgi:hypothetical protein